MKRMVLTVFWTLAYCFIWMALEKIIYSNITPRLIDDIMMLLFIPMIYKAMENSERSDEDER